MTAGPLTDLLALQGVDTSIDQHRWRLAHLPEAAEAQALADRGRDLETRTLTASAVRDEVAGRQAVLEAELATTEARAAEVDRRLYSGQGGASRDLTAMSAEVATLRQRASGLEDRVLEVLEEREPLDAAIDVLVAERATVVDAEAVAVERRDAARVALGAELADLVEQRTQAAAAIPADLLGLYERIRVRSDGVGAARLVGHRCDGCHLDLPATEVDRVRHAAPDAVVTCDNCGRILVH